MPADSVHHHAMDVPTNHPQFTFVASHDVTQLLRICQTNCIHEFDTTGKGRMMQRHQNGGPIRICKCLLKERQDLVNPCERLVW